MAEKIALPTIAALPKEASTRTRILTAGVEVLHTEGFAALTQQAVAAKAGVRQSHITYYFPTRLDLLRATAQFGCESMMAPIANAAASGSLTYEEFRELILPEIIDRNWWRLMMALVSACSESSEIRRWIVEFDAQICNALRLGFRAYDVDVSVEDTQFIHASYIGALTLDMQEMSDGSHQRARSIVNAAIEVVVNRAAARHEAKPKSTTAAPLRTTPTSTPPPPSTHKAQRRPSTSSRRVGAKSQKATHR